MLKIIYSKTDGLKEGKAETSHENVSLDSDGAVEQEMVLQWCRLKQREVWSTIKKAVHKLF